ncbi:MAG: hydrogenase 3 maturation endopeptidase HyCI [Candidatus Omnitrophica bacterium]|nr:hydrogenase 3 maturation endopeptidase HyCI [Candidatus Omnitrophota bacterium]MDD5670559.1 hydrogenase 3 maturation endopeptidase HyCI [Candidatus Omnitrophota bacterium]
MSNLLTAEVSDALKPSSGSGLILTAGNPFRRDDGVGPYIASRLQGSSAKIIDAGLTPENIIDEVIGLKPDRMTVIDAADFGGYPGEVKVIPEDLIAETSLSTHEIPMNVITKIISDGTQAEVVFIGIQPQTVALGEGLSERVQASAEAIIQTVLQAYSKPR